MYPAAKEAIHAPGPLFQRTFGSEGLVGPFIIGGYLIWHLVLEQCADLPEFIANSQTVAGPIPKAVFFFLAALQPVLRAFSNTQSQRIFSSEGFVLSFISGGYLISSSARFFFFPFLGGGV